MTDLTVEKLNLREAEMWGEDHYPDGTARFYEWPQPFLRELFALARHALTARDDEIERLRDALINLNAPIDKMWSDSFGRKIDEKHVRAITEAQAGAFAVLYKDKTVTQIVAEARVASLGEET